MTKTITIDRCYDCPHYTEDPPRCWHQKRLKKTYDIEDPETIPEWCPLPDAKMEEDELCEECGTKLIHADLVRCPKCTAELFEELFKSNLITSEL